MRDVTDDARVRWLEALEEAHWVDPAVGEEAEGGWTRPRANELAQVVRS